MFLLVNILSFLIHSFFSINLLKVWKQPLLMLDMLACLHVFSFTCHVWMYVCCRGHLHRAHPCHRSRWPAVCFCLCCHTCQTMCYTQDSALCQRLWTHWNQVGTWLIKVIFNILKHGCRFSLIELNLMLQLGCCSWRFFLILLCHCESFPAYDYCSTETAG